MSRVFRINAAVILAAIASLPTIAHATDSGPDEPTILVCGPDTPLAYPNGKVRLNVWVKQPEEGGKTRFIWQTGAGKIESRGKHALWDLSGVRPGTYHASVQVLTDGNNTKSCQLTVRVALPPFSLMGSGIFNGIANGTSKGGFESGLSFLLSGQQEAKGYGLYSYLLFGAEPDETSRQRYQATIMQILRFPNTNSLERAGFKRSELNITYLPLEKPLPLELAHELAARNHDKYMEMAKWIIQHYDYARARLLLRNIAGDNRKGPYLIAFLHPLGSNTIEPPYLYINMSAVPPSRAGTWIRYFQNQAAQNRYWDEKAGARLVLELRTVISVAAEGLPDILESLENWLAWKDKLG